MTGKRITSTWNIVHCFFGFFRMSNERRKNRIRERTNDQTPTSELFKHESTTTRIFRFSGVELSSVPNGQVITVIFSRFQPQKSRNHQMNVLELFGQMYPTRFVQKIESESQFFDFFTYHNGRSSPFRLCREKRSTTFRQKVEFSSVNLG